LVRDILPVWLITFDFQRAQVLIESVPFRAVRQS
jgi:hypothetical protein